MTHFKHISDTFQILFWLIQAKRKMKMKKFEKMISIFEFSISKVCYVAIFMKICAKKILTDFVRHFWLIKAKMKMKLKKIWENELGIGVFHIKFRLYGTFYKNLRKTFFPKFLPFKFLLGQVSKGLVLFSISIMCVSMYSLRIVET